MRNEPLLVRRGNKADLPTGGTLYGELRFAKNTRELYIDDGTENFLLNSTYGASYKGSLDCSANPNYPAADLGFLYFISVSGKVGGASGHTVTAGDAIICEADDTPAGTEAAVGDHWTHIEDVFTYNTVDVGTTTTGVAGSSASVTNSGTSQNAIFDFAIPRGDKGETGNTGTTGADGTDGVSLNWKGTYDADTTYEINDGVAYNGTSYIWINATPASGQTPADNTYWDILALNGANVNVYASVAEINTGTEVAKSVSPDALAGSNMGTRGFNIYCVEAGIVLTTGDGKGYARVPAFLNGHDIVGVAATLMGHESTSGEPIVQIAIGRQANATTAHAYEDLLSTRITIDATEWDSKDATAAAVIDADHHNILTGDLIRVDCDGAGTGAMGLIVTVETRLP
jgi:hypothetical protein